MTQQLDILRHSDPELAKAYREAAESVLRDPYWLPDEAKKRADYYREQAERIEGQGR